MFSTETQSHTMLYFTAQVRRSPALTAVDQMTCMRVKMKSEMEARDAGNEEV